MPENTSCISLARYVEKFGLQECGFWGVREPGTLTQACSAIWSEPDRRMIAESLEDAQEEIEIQIGHPLCPTWIEDELRPYSSRIKADWNLIIEAGIEASYLITAGAVVDHSADPAVIGPLGTALTSAEEIRVYYPGTDIEITPEEITIAGGAMTITIPRCRMVAVANWDNPSTGWDYTDLTVFTATVDVGRVYNDPSTQASLIWRGRGASGTCSSCSDHVDTGCIIIQDQDIGYVSVAPATYYGGVWARSSAACLCGRPDYVLLNYRAGFDVLTRQAESALLRLAHSKLPDEPCGCDRVQRFWARDREMPKLMTRERLNCPFGLNQGAWIAWRFTQAMAKRRVMVI